MAYLAENKRGKSKRIRLSSRRHMNVQLQQLKLAIVKLQHEHNVDNRRSLSHDKGFMQSGQP